MLKAEIFNITTAKAEQQKLEMQLSPVERIILCLDLMDLSASVSANNRSKYPEDSIKWIELSFKNE